MRVGYSILREINNKTNGLVSSDYGLKEFEFDRMVKLLEKLIERVLRTGEKISLRPAKITEKGISYLKENSQLEEHYPFSKSELKEWVQEDKLRYSNGADAE